MDTFVVNNEAWIRGGVFFSFLAIMLVWQAYEPFRAEVLPRARRWLANMGLVVVDALVLRLLFPILAVGAAITAQQQNWGVFNVLDVPLWLALIVSIVVLDAAIYFQHVVFHKVPVLWRLHRVHHSDVDFDVTTALRFHPIEIALSMAYKMALVIAIGVPPAAVIVFEVILNAMALFNHGNVRLPAPVDALLRRIIVTPDMHRVHHSVREPETNSNYGFNFSIWDKMFGTYRSQPRDGHEGMTIGLDAYRDPDETSLIRLITQPFR
jgi:sterol desaturase/sphingolipid hydroxylase (fatty acid hydroxylase superfamily)